MQGNSEHDSLLEGCEETSESHSPDGVKEHPEVPGSPDIPHFAQPAEQRVDVVCSSGNSSHAESSDPEEDVIEREGDHNISCVEARSNQTAEDIILDVPIDNAVERQDDSSDFPELPLQSERGSQEGYMPMKPCGPIEVAKARKSTDGASSATTEILPVATHSPDVCGEQPQKDMEQYKSNKILLQPIIQTSQPSTTSEAAPAIHVVTPVKKVKRSTDSVTMSPIAATSMHNSFTSDSKNLLSAHGLDSPSSSQYLGRQVAMQLSRNKISATYVNAKVRSAQVQEAEKRRRASNKTIWATLVLVFKRIREIVDSTSLWGSRIQAVEGKHGSNVALILYFFRWTLLLNIMILLLWSGMVIVPFILHPPAHFSWSIFTDSSVAELLQGYGLSRTWFLYGGYNYPTGAEFGGWYWYQPDIAFPLAIAGMYILSFCAVLHVIWKRMSGSGDATTVEQNRTYPFSSVVFASWDFHLRNQSAAKSLQSSIRKQIVEMSHDICWNQRTMTLSQRIMKGATKIIGTFILWPVTVIMTTVALYYIIEKGDELNEYFKSGYAQSVAITLVSILSQTAVRSTVKYEGWHPRVAQQVEAVKLFSVKAVNLGIIIFQLYSIQEMATEASRSLEDDLNKSVSSLDPCDSTVRPDTCDNGFACCNEGCTKTVENTALLDHCVPVCEEDVMGLIFYRLLVTNGIIISLQEIAVAFFLSKCFKKPSEIDVAKFFVQIIETQAFVWLGSMTAPVLPAFGVLSILITFYVKTWLAFNLYNPPETACSASRNSNLLYTLMLVTLLLCSVPMSTTFSTKRDWCGPHKKHSMAWALTEKIKAAPGWLKGVIRWLTNPMILGAAVLALGFALMFQRAQKNRYQKQARDFKTEFIKYRSDMQAKMAESRKASSRGTSIAGSFTSQRILSKNQDDPSCVSFENPKSKMSDGTLSHLAN